MADFLLKIIEDAETFSNDNDNDFFSEKPLTLTKKRKHAHNNADKFKQQFPTLKQFKEFLLQPISASKVEEMMQLEQHFENGQANPEWLRSRLIQSYAKRISGSSIAGVVGKNPYTNQQKALLDFLYPSFKGNACTIYGNKFEDTCENMFFKKMYTRVIEQERSPCGQFELQDVSIKHYGLCTRADRPFMGYSPDGVLEEVWQHIQTKETHTKRILLEYKCPYSKRNATIKTIKEKYGNLYPQKIIDTDKNIVLPVPIQYYCQIMMGMLTLYDTVLQETSIHDVSDAYFVVWCPAETGAEDDCFGLSHEDWVNDRKNAIIYSNTEGTIQVTRVQYNHQFAQNMIQDAEHWWKNEYVPLLYKKLAGEIAHNEITLTKPIDIDVFMMS